MNTQKPPQHAERENRGDIISTVQTPLGFFVLIVLIVEVVFGIIASMSSGSDRTYLIVGMLAMMFILVLIVAIMAFFRPRTLYGEQVQIPKQTVPELKGNDSVVAVPLVGYSAVYIEAERLVVSSSGSEIIRATSAGAYSDTEEDLNGEDEYTRYLRALATKCGEAKKKGLDAMYTVIVGFRPDDKGVPPPHKQRGIARRRTYFKETNALDRLDIRYMDSTWSLDVLILGKEHMIVGFPTLHKDRELRLGIRISGQAFVERAVQWFDHCILRESKPVTWTGERTQQ